MLRNLYALRIIPVLFALLILTASAAPSSAASSQNMRLKLDATLTCAEGGGADISFTVTNIGKRTVIISPDFHLALGAVRPGGQEGVAIFFVFPAPGFNVIEPGAQSRFLLDVGKPFEGEPSSSLSGQRLIMSAEVYLAGREKPVTRHFSLPACDG